MLFPLEQLQKTWHHRRSRRIIRKIGKNGLTLPRFTQIVWQQIFGNDADAQDGYYSINIPDDVRRYHREQEKSCGIEWIDSYTGELSDAANNIEMKVVAVDDEFLQWCKERDTNVCLKAMASYVHSLTDTDCQRLYSKNQWDVGYEVMFLNVAILMDGIPPKTSYSVSKELADMVQDQLCRDYGDDFVAFPYLLNADTIPGEEKNIREFGKIYFETGVKIRYDTWDIQENEGSYSDLLSLYLPIVHRYHSESYKYKVADELKASEGIPYLSTFDNDATHVDFAWDSEIVDRMRVELDNQRTWVGIGLIDSIFVSFIETMLHSIVFIAKTGQNEVLEEK